MSKSEKRFTLFVVLFTIAFSILFIIYEKKDEQLQKVLFLEKNLKIIKNQYIKNGDMESIQLIKRNNEFDGYFMNIDKEYFIIKGEDQELVLLGVSGKFNEIKNKDERDKVKNDLCPRLFRSLVGSDVILNGVVASSNNVNDIIILKRNMDYCEILDKKDKIYLILDSKLTKEKNQNEK